MLKILIVLAVTVIPYAHLYLLDVANDIQGNGCEKSEFHEQPRQSASISLEQFTVLKKLGNGFVNTVYLVKKNGGSDDGKLYALKAVNYLNVAMNEREVLEAVRGMPWATGLIYAFIEGKWTFLVMGLGSGGDVEKRTGDNLPNEVTARLILAEAVDAVEKLHKMNITHRDIGLHNIVVGDDGHLMLTDFGFSRSFGPNDDTNKDWIRFPNMCRRLFSNQILNDDKNSLIEKFYDMTDTNLLDLKNHPYFGGIDWEKVAERSSESPFPPSVIEIDHDNTIDLRAELKIGADDTIPAKFAERFQNFSFVVPEYRMN